MPQESHITLLPEDAAIITDRAQQLGLTPSALLTIAAHALAQHLRSTDHLHLPLTISAGTFEASLRSHNNILKGQFG